MGLALYRKYRSKSLDEIVGQSHITDILRRSIASGNVAHAYLLTGPRGVGKTSIARILAHEINGLPYSDESTHLDIIEIDAASNNSVEDIRDLRERVQIAPTSAAKKVYIIDEVHMLSKSAFNALLKTLEEPPAHVVFILATTDVEKLPATIVSRTQRFNFRAISVDDAVAHLTMIAKNENIPVDQDALLLIAEHSMGSFRDSISMLDQLQHSEGGKITTRAVEAMMGLAPRETIDALIQAYRSQDITTIVTTLNRYEQQGTPASTLVRQLIGFINSKVIDEPDLLSLLDSLLDATKSAWPYVKLMTALAVTRSDPHTLAPKTMSDQSASTIPDKSDKAPQSLVTVQKEETVKTPKPSKPPAKATVPHHNEPFAWEKFLAVIKEQASGIYTILLKCNYTYDGATLTIYAGRKFNKTQIDKSHTLLAHSFELLSPGSTEVVVLAETQTPENSQTAAVLDIMGGGQEVKL
ncbi:MAG: DNA polymerase III subunit gamma/tau [Candidatus Saccharimonas sp.]